MPKLSQRGVDIPPSPIRKLVPFAEAAKARGTHVYHLNIGQPDISTPQSAIDAVKGINDRVLAYGHSAGLEEYRRKLAGYYQQVGIEVDYRHLMITVGGSEALFMALSVCLDSGDEVLVPEPFYANYNGFAQESGVVVKPITSTIEDDFALPPIAYFERHITPRTKAILICNPNNPTGYLYSLEELEQLRDIVLKHDLYLISDEVYREFCYDGAVHHSVMNLKGLEHHAVMIDSVSKRYSMCGVRLGAVVTHNEEVLGAMLRIAQARLCPPYLAQVAAMGALDTPATYFEEVHREYTLRRDTIVAALNAIEGVYCPMPRGAFYATVQLPVEDAEGFARWLLEEFSYKGATVMVAPASGFYSTSGLGHNQVRIAYVLNTTDLLAAAECLKQALACYNSL